MKYIPIMLIALLFLFMVYNLLSYTLPNAPLPSPARYIKQKQVERDRRIADMKAQSDENEKILEDNRNAIAYIKQIGDHDGMHVIHYDGTEMVTEDAFSESVLDLLYSESAKVKGVNFELISKYCADVGVSTSSVEAVGDTFANDALGIVHYTYMGGDRIFRIYLATDLETGYCEGFLEVPAYD